MLIYNKDIEKQKQVFVEGILEEIALPIIVMNINKGILFVAPNHTRYINKIRNVYPGIMFGAIGDIVVINRFHKELVFMAHHMQMNYRDPKAVTLNKLEQPIQEQLLMNYSDARLRPFVMNFVLAQENIAFIIDYTGSIEEVEENSIGIIGTNGASGQKGQKQILLEILEQKLEPKAVLTDLTIEQGVSICKKALTEAGFKAKFFEVGKLEKDGKTSIEKEER